MRAASQQVGLQHTPHLLKICQELGWLVNLEKSELEPKQIFDFVGYQSDLRAGRVRPTPDRWQNYHTRNTVTTGLSGPAVHVCDGFTNSHRKAVSPRPTSYETHTVASQKQLEGTRVTRKGDYNTKVLAPTFTMVATRGHWPYRLTITPSKTCSTTLFRHMKRRVGPHLNECTAGGTWFLPESKLHISDLDLKAVFLALKEFQDLCIHKIVLVATDNTTVVSYISKEGGMRLGPLCVPEVK